MPEAFEIKINASEVAEKFQRLADRSTHMKPANEEIGALLAASITENFEIEGGFPVCCFAKVA
ncbi:MAG: hypothetical protein ACE5GQ_03300 [Nitrospinales bacterium]